MFPQKMTLDTFRKCAVTALALAAFAPFSGAKPDTLERDKIPAQYKWDYSEIYANYDAWEVAFKSIEADIAKFATLKGTLKNGATALLAAYDLSDKINAEYGRLYRYIMLQNDADAHDKVAAANLQRVSALAASYGTAGAWFSSELTEIPRETVEKWIAETPELEKYRFPISNQYRRKAHVHDEQTEKLLSYGALFNGTTRSIFRALSTGDIKFPEVTLSDGKKLTITPGAHRSALEQQPVQGDRRLVAMTHLGNFTATGNTYAAIYNATIQQGWMRAQQRTYPTVLASALGANNIPEAVVDTLLDTTRDGTQPLRRYMRLKKRMLGVKEFHLYDQTASLIEDTRRFEYKDAKKIVLNSAKPLGEEYHSKLAKYLTGRRIDVYENIGKRSGAYNAGVPGVGPYVLMNYTNATGDVFTLAHELGHSMHSILSMEYQPHVTSNYTIYVAEVASIMSERYLLDEMLRNTNDPKERFLLLQKAADGIVGTFYRQTLFANFERSAHRLAEEGKPITQQALSKIYHDLLKEYYGDAVLIDDFYADEWMRIPHFFNSPYYVYQYATCYAASAELYNKLTGDDENLRKETLEKYLTLLKSGGNDYPNEQLKKAGIDLTKRQTIQAVIDRLDSLVTQLEIEAEKIK